MPETSQKISEVMGPVAIKIPPPPIGYWVLQGSSSMKLRFGVDRAPAWFHRKMVKLFFGIDWEWVQK